MEKVRCEVVGEGVRVAVRGDECLWVEGVRAFGRGEGFLMD
jgi:hypothetical protein